MDADEQGELFSNPCESKPEMTWVDFGGGRIGNPAFNLCLQDFGNASVSAVDCTDSARQSWLEQGSMIVNEATGACLASGFGYIYTTSCDDKPEEQWSIRPA